MSFNIMFFLVFGLFLPTLSLSQDFEDCSVLPEAKISSELVPESSLTRCQSYARCEELDLECLKCSCPRNCSYGKLAEATCESLVQCVGNATHIVKQFVCRYCFQTTPSEHSCEERFDCQATVNEKVRTNCTANQEVLCLGNREFLKRMSCSWTAGYKWTTALALSITLGGFGADRFYLGQWQEGIGKLFSFGGLGVWTLVDSVMVAIRYIGPADGSLYSAS